MKFTLVIIIMLFSSCYSNLYKRERFTYAPKERQIWIDSYKYEVFYGCIKEGIQNDSLRIILKPRDLFSKNTNVDFQILIKQENMAKKLLMRCQKLILK